MFLEIGRLRGSIDTSSAPGDDDGSQWQYLRLPAAKGLSLEVSKLCALANDSQSFYRSVSSKQWLRTVVSLDDSSILSNVVPRDAYLLRGNCLDPGRCQGFSPLAEIELNLKLEPLAEIELNRSCRSCALAQQMQDEVRADGQMVDAGQMIQNIALLQIEDQVDDVQDLAQGAVHKVVWRRGTFVRKRFDCREIFERELAVATAVLHPNLVHCFGWSWLESDGGSGSDSDGSDSDCGDERWIFDLFMECLEVDLQRFLIEEAAGEVLGTPFAFHDTLNVLLQVAEGMKHLHESGFVHGDLKPQNVFLSRVQLAHTGVQCYLVKVGDFGCAQRVDAPFCDAIGTLDYTAPEVFRCRYRGAPPPLDPQKIDVFSFGVVAFQVLTGAVNLYVGYRRGSDVAEAVMNGIRPRRLVLEGASLDCRSFTLVMRCWAENPEERPSFSQICDELNRCSKEHGLRVNLAKRKHYDGVVEETNYLKFAKPALESV